MPQYLVSVYNNEKTRQRSAEEMAPIHEAVSAVNQKAIDDGIFVFAGGLHELSAATVVNATSGTPVVSDGPYLETREYIGGFWIVELPDFDAVLAWAKTAAVACAEPIEIRPFMEGPPEAS